MASLLKFLLVLWAVPATAQTSLPEKLAQKLSEYGIYQEKFPQEERPLKALQQLIDKVRGPQHAPIIGIISGDPDPNAFVYREKSSGPIYIVFNYGLLESMQTEDQLVVAIGHEVHHTDTFDDGRSLVSRQLQRQREEIKVADYRGMERALELGYNPQEVIPLLLSLADPGSGSVLEALFGSHPKSEVRLTAIQAWLSKWDGKKEFPKARPLNPIFRGLRPPRENNLPKAPVARKLSPDDVLPALKFIVQSASYKVWDPITRFLVLSMITLNTKEGVSLLSRIESGDLIGSLERKEFDGLRNLKISDWRVNSSDKVYQLLLGSLKVAPGQVLPLSDEQLMKIVGVTIYQLIEPVYLGNNRASELQLAALNRLIPSSPQELKAWTFESLKEHQPYTKFIGKEFSQFVLFELLEDEKSANQIYDLLSFGFQIVYASSLRRFMDDTSPITRRQLQARALELLRFAISKNDDTFVRNWCIFQAEELRGYFDLVVKESRNAFEAVGMLFAIHEEMRPLKYVPFKEADQFAAKIAQFANSKIHSVEEIMVPHSALFTPNVIASLLKTLHPLKLSKGQALEIIARDSFWQVSHYSELRETISGRQVLDILPGDLQATIKLVSKLESPTYKFDLQHSSIIQEWLVASLKLSGMEEMRSARSLQEWREIWFYLASRGASEIVDQLAVTLFSDEALNTLPVSSETLISYLKSGLIWDFSLRFKLWNDIKQTQLQVSSYSQDRESALKKDLELIVSVFPEFSFERTQALEDYANNIEANERETQWIELLKMPSDANLEGAALRIFTAVVEVALRENQVNKSTVPSLISFLMGKGAFPDLILGSDIKTIGIDRWRRLFISLPPEVRALVLNPLLIPPRGMLSMEKGEDLVIKLILEDVKEYRVEFELFLRAMLYALDKAAPFEKSLALSMMLSLKTGKNSVPTGVLIRQTLEALGGTGVSIGQKIRQRQLLPSELAMYLDDLQDRAMVPSRHSIFALIKSYLRLESVDKVLRLKAIKGAASARIAVVVNYFAGPHAGEDVMLKLQREDLERKTEVESRKLNFAREYLEEHGGARFRVLRSIFAQVKRALLIQTDNRQESWNFERIAALYRSGEVDPQTGFIFEVVNPLAALGIKKKYNHEQVARIQALKDLTPEEAAIVYQALFNKESSILFKETSLPNEVIEFEADRHRGNYIADLQANRPHIYVIDYPLLTSVTAQDRDTLIQVLGLIYALTAPEMQKRVSGVPQFISGRIVKNYGFQFVMTELGSLLEDVADQKWEAFQKQAYPILARKSDLSHEDSVVAKVLAVVNLAEQNGMPFREGVHDFLTSLGHLEFYAQHSGLPNASTALFEKIEQNFRKNFREPEQLSVSSSIRYLFKPSFVPTSELRCSEVLQ